MACMMAAPTVFSLRAQCAFRSPPCRPYEPPANSPSLSPEAQPFQPGRIRVEWKRPQEGWFKLNFDGSVYNDGSGSGRASIGGVIRDCNGRVVAAFAERTEHAMVGIVEARALILGLRLALEVDHRFLGKITKLVVEGDDLVLVKLLRRDDMYRRISQAMEDEIRMLLGCFSEHQLQHIYREGNQVADALCHEAYQRPGMWTGDFLPPAAREKERADASRVQHQRICKAKV